jgi:hypothetical protein
MGQSAANQRVGLPLQSHIFDGMAFPKSVEIREVS